MKCPNCGKEMAEGSLYCEQCGQDIHIVPDFEPELELDIEQTIRDIVEELHEESASQAIPLKKGKKWKRGKWLVLTSCLILGILVTVFIVLRIIEEYRYNSSDYQVSMAKRYVDEEQYEDAVTCYNRALELDAGNIELLFRLAEVYFLKNDKTEYEYLLREIVAREDADIEQLERAYGKLIAIYRAKEDYETINDLLLASENSMIISTYWSYIAEAPEFSIQGGYYTSVQALKLAASGSGKIYYTMDGSEPTENATQYTAPIILENGDYFIKAVFVNEKGVFSDVVSKEYHIENDVIDAPEVSLLGGDYFFPISIEILNDDEEVYYTTDGTDPTYSSHVYTGPIPMPLGKSTFRFAKIVNGVTGTVAERKYNLVMNTDFTPKQAVEAVVQYALDSGKIYDKEGYFDGSGDCYCYEYQYVTNINKIDDFYVIAEIYRTASGALTKTGNYYAVNAYTEKIFKLNQENGNDTLIELEINTDFQEEE